MTMSKQKILLLFFWILIFTGCKKFETPTEFEFENSFTKKEYTNDSTIFVELVEKQILQNSGPFYPDKYDLKSEVIIDTIIYSPINDRAAIFVLVKTSNSKLALTNDPNGYHYDARCFLAISKDHKWTINWFRVLNLNHYSSKDEISSDIRYKYFDQLSTFNDFEYNVDDKRFWTEPLWENLNGIQEEQYESGN